MTEEKALLAAICQHAHEDTPRLVYADWLDENADRSACDKCRGVGGFFGPPTRNDKGGFTYGEKCPKCGGEKVMPDDRAARAEFIRVQCALSHLPAYDNAYPKCGACGGDGLSGPPPYHRKCRRCDGTGREDFEAFRRHAELIRREHDLLAANCRWRAATCPDCEFKVTRDVCLTCGGLRDLLSVRYYGDVVAADEEFRAPRPVKAVLRRGFVDEILVQRCAVWSDGFRPTPWVKALARVVPLTAIRVPTLLSVAEYGGGDDRWRLYRPSVPPAVWDALCPGSGPSHAFAERREEGDIADPLARTLADWVRAAAFAKGGD